MHVRINLFFIRINLNYSLKLLPRTDFDFIINRRRIYKHAQKILKILPLGLTHQLLGSEALAFCSPSQVKYLKYMNISSPLHQPLSLFSLSRSSLYPHQFICIPISNSTLNLLSKIGTFN